MREKLFAMVVSPEPPDEVKEAFIKIMRWTEEQRRAHLKTQRSYQEAMQQAMDAAKQSEWWERP